MIDRIAEAAGKAHAQYLGSKALQAEYPGGCWAWVAVNVLAEMRVPTALMAHTGVVEAIDCGLDGPDGVDTSDVEKIWRAMINGAIRNPGTTKVVNEETGAIVWPENKIVAGMRDAVAHARRMMEDENA